MAPGGWNVRIVLIIAMAGAAACNQSPSQGSRSAQPTAAVTTTPPTSAAPSPTTAPSTTSPSAGFRATDVTFVSATRGWVIGGSQVERTTDGGRSWSALTRPPAGVTHLRFASTTTGYSWVDQGPLWTTTDAATSWHPGGLDHVVALETASGAVWALAGAVPYPHVWRATVGSSHFVKLGVTPNRTATLDVHGSTAYVTGQQGAGPIAASLDVWHGTTRRHESLPCTAGNASVPFSALGVSTDGSLFLVCNLQANDQTSQKAYRSTDQARSWRSTPAPPIAPDDVTAVPGRLFAWGHDLDVQSNGQWSVSLSGPSSANGFLVVGFQTETNGVALSADGVLHLTSDTGQTWTAAHP